MKMLGGVSSSTSPAPHTEQVTVTLYRPRYPVLQGPWGKEVPTRFRYSGWKTAAAVVCMFTLAAIPGYLTYKRDEALRDEVPRAYETAKEAQRRKRRAWMESDEMPAR